MKPNELLQTCIDHKGPFRLDVIRLYMAYKQITKERAS